MNSIREQVKAAIFSLVSCEREGLDPVSLLVIGASSSEVHGGAIGKDSQPDLGREIAEAAIETADALGIRLAFQCCEHLNRALVVERETAKTERARIVSAVPHPKAGGSVASAAYRLLKDPVLVEEIKADAGLDIGLTLIGMHLRSVAVPIRVVPGKIGEAVVTAARTRPPLIGGERAKYSL